jgi:hypothetical protein
MVQDMIATQRGGRLKPMTDCYIKIGDFPIYMYILPDISDSHSASYNTKNGTGRSLPTYTFSYGEARTIGWNMHLYADSYDALSYNLKILRMLEALTYPRSNAKNLPFLPPNIVKLKCGEVLGSYEICAVLKSYSVKFPNDVPWSPPLEGFSYIPYKIDVDLSFEAVYDAGTLPGSERIITDGN